MALTRTRLAAIGVAGALTLTATVSALTPALAQDADEAPDTTRQERHAAREAAFAEALAEELDLPADRVSAALDAVREQMREEAKAAHLTKLKERLDAAVEDGSLTQEQADAIYAAAESGVMPFGRGPGRRGGPHGGRHAPFSDDAEAASSTA